MSNTTYKDANEAWEAGNQWVHQSNRYEKLDFIMETASVETKDYFLNEIIQWMGEEAFDGFFDHLRRNWEIKTPQELDYALNS